MYLLPCKFQYNKFARLCYAYIINQDISSVIFYVRIWAKNCTKKNWQRMLYVLVTMGLIIVSMNMLRSFVGILIFLHAYQDLNVALVCVENISSLRFIPI